MNCLSIYIKLVGVFLEFSNRADFASISTPVLSIITTLLINYIEKLNFKKKSFLHVFYEKWRGDARDIFVERMKLYHSLKVQDTWIFFIKIWILK